MTTEEKLDRLTEMVALQGAGFRTGMDELRGELAKQAKNITALAGVVNTLATSVASHDEQIEALIKAGEAHDSRLRDVTEAVANLEKQWQAYVNTLPRN